VTDRCKLGQKEESGLNRNHVSAELALPDCVWSSSHLAGHYLVGLVPEASRGNTKMAKETFLHGPVRVYGELRVVLGVGSLAEVPLQPGILEGPRHS
jgi:hypothetical protein